MNNNSLLPLISIIVPVYNVQEYVRKCVLSICRQTYQNLEIIVIDDGSTDDSGRICDMLAKQDNRIKVVHQSNGGLSAARNMGLSIVTGDFIGFVDSDDWIDESMYELLYGLMIENDADISICSHYIVKQGKIKSRYMSGKKFVFTREEAMQALMKDRLIRNYVWNKLYKRHLFDQLRFPVGRLFEDLAISYQIFHQAKRVVVQEYPEYYYLVRDGSLTQSKYDPEREYQIFRGVCEQDEFVRANYSWEEIPPYVLWRGVHLIDHIMMVKPSALTDKIIENVLTKMHEYDYIRLSKKQLTLCFKRYFIYHHIALYRSIYRAVRIVFRSKRYKY